MWKLKLTTEEFIARAKAKHGEKYDYTLVNYFTNTTKVKIICRVHGTFEQSPASHIKNGGCKLCGSERSALKRKGKNSITTEEFITRAKKVHGVTFDYSKSNYLGAYKKLEIVCSIHGSFWQSPQAHIYWGYGCEKCSAKKKGKWGQGMSTEEFIKSVKLKYGDRYDYSKTVYTGLTTKDKITIACKEHGEFSQLTLNHYYSGAGCPKCKRSIGETIVADYLKELEVNFIEEHSFPDCKHKRKLFFDFYLPDYNMCIEFDGAQHTNPKTHMNGKAIEGKDFKTMQLRDRIKNEYCVKNKIKLIRISHKEIKNIREIIKNNLNDN